MKLTTTVLKKIIAEELSRFNESKLFGDMRQPEDVDADELDADEFGTDNALENPIDHYKALGLEETRLIHRLAQIHEAKKSAAKKAAAKKMADKEMANKKAAAKKMADKKAAAKHGK